MHTEVDNDTAYNAAATYRQSLSWITAKAVDHLQHCNVEWKHAKIYAIELDNVPIPDVPGPKYAEILEEAKTVLRALVNVE